MSKSKAADLLSHYFRTAFTKAGLHWDSDNDSEMEQIIDEILEAARAGERP